MSTPSRTYHTCHHVLTTHAITCLPYMPSRAYHTCHHVPTIHAITCLPYMPSRAYHTCHHVPTTHAITAYHACYQVPTIQCHHVPTIHTCPQVFLVQADLDSTLHIPCDTDEHLSQVPLMTPRKLPNTLKSSPHQRFSICH